MQKKEKSKKKQAKIEDNLRFLLRVDNYQRVRGLKKAEACKEIGISESRLSDIRNSGVPVSSKFWLRLEQAEVNAGIPLRKKSLPGLEWDIPPKHQPSDEHMRALDREDDPIVKRRYIYSDMASALKQAFSNDWEMQKSILDVVSQILYISASVDGIKERLTEIEGKLDLLSDQMDVISRNLPIDDKD